MEKEITLDEYNRLVERLREVKFELAMKDTIGWGPYIQDLEKEKSEIINKLNNYEIKK